MKNLLVVSGGIESSVLQHLFPQAQLFFVDYGQKNNVTSLENITYHAKKLDQKVNTYHTKILKDLYKDALQFRVGGREAEITSLDSYFSNYYNYIDTKTTWLEGRGSLIALYASIFAARNGLDRVVFGFQYDKETWESDGDFTLSDTSHIFLERVQGLINVSFKNKIRLYAPFIDEKNTKEEIVKLGVVLGVNFYYTNSCEYSPRCFTCPQCLRAERALLANNIKPLWLER